MITFTDVVGFAGMALSAIGLLLGLWIKRTERKLRESRAAGVQSAAYISPSLSLEVNRGSQITFIVHEHIPGEIYTPTVPVLSELERCTVAIPIATWGSFPARVQLGAQQSNRFVDPAARLSMPNARTPRMIGRAGVRS